MQCPPSSDGSYSGGAVGGEGRGNEAAAALAGGVVDGALAGAPRPNRGRVDSPNTPRAAVGVGVGGAPAESSVEMAGMVAGDPSPVGRRMLVEGSVGVESSGVGERTSREEGRGGGEWRGSPHAQQSKAD